MACILVITLGQLIGLLEMNLTVNENMFITVYINKLSEIRRPHFLNRDAPKMCKSFKNLEKKHKKSQDFALFPKVFVNFIIYK